MSGKLGIAERYTRKTRQLRVAPDPEPAPMPPPEPYPPSVYSKSAARAQRLGSKVATVVTTSFDVIEKPETPPPLRRKYCDKLRGMGIPADQLPDWCNSAEARAVIDLVGRPVTAPGAKTGDAALDDLEGGRRRRRRTRRKPVKRRRRRTLRISQIRNSISSKRQLIPK